MRRRNKVAASLTAALLLVAGLTACTGAGDDLAQQYRSGDGKGYIAADFAVHEYKPGDQPPAISFEGTLDDGSDVSSTTYAGTVTVVNFWWANCAPCRTEAPVLKQADAAFADQDVAFLGVNTYDQAATARSFAKEFGITYPSVIDADTKSVTSAFVGVVPLGATPSTVILDKDGRPTARIVGAIPDASILESLIKTALGSTS
ncbi:TlpA family protein disulfide reductase [Microbacterium protaetiae]|uniref:TlpA family protein disulfide reductase n=1 Tax=Microbacterium protaetiae TaxID=2509458 RepID=A0A4P6EE32_9MICO|nr:TlpA disulfide reductase family protein [Microbacterium protaetiae]QAY60404.1 TlpA family protein disulfide reductase [Microbacterium protaetiae]